MKKTYVKPQIMFESFSLSTNIAANCNPVIDSQSSGTCAYTHIDEFGDQYVVFTDSVQACKNAGNVETDGEWNTICYDVPTGALNLFNS